MIKIKSQLNQLVSISIIIAVFSIFISCEKDPDGLGLNIIPDEDNLLAKTDSAFDIYATTIRLDSLYAFYPDSAISIYPKVLLGDYTDPVYGNTKASILINFFPDSTNHSFGTNAIVDSLILYIQYDSILGDKSGNMNLKISELNKALNYKEKYYLNTDYSQYKGRVLEDTLVQYKDTLFRIKITDQEFISKLINVPSSATENFMAFQQYFKGFHIEMQAMSSPGAVAYISPWVFNSYSRLTMYYRTPTDTINFNYVSSRRTARFNEFIHNFTGTPVEAALQNTTLDQKITYVKGMGGVGTRIRIPSLSRWADEAPVSINKAELIIPAVTEGENPALFPKRLSIMAVPANGRYTYIEYGFGQTFIGGLYNAEKKIYTFNLTKHLQKIANSKLLGSTVENTDLVIIADGYKPGFIYSVSRVPLDFTSGKGAKLNIIYSKQ